MATWKVLVLMLAAFLIVGCGQVDPGERAVFVQFGVINEKCYPEGLYFYNPFSTNMDVIDIKVQRYKIKTTAASSDLQDVHMVMIVNFAIDGRTCHELYRTVGWDFKERVLDPAGTEVAKAATALFAVERIIKERPKLKEAIIAGLKARLEPYHLDVHDVALTNIEFSKEFAHAIEQKQIEEQNVQKQEYLRQQAVKHAEQAVARAEGEAKANMLVRQSLSAELLQFEALKKWDGVLPTVVSSGAMPFIVNKQIP